MNIFNRQFFTWNYIRSIAVMVFFSLSPEFSYASENNAISVDRAMAILLRATETVAARFSQMQEEERAEELRAAVRDTSVRTKQFEGDLPPLGLQGDLGVTACDTRASELCLTVKRWSKGFRRPYWVGTGVSISSILRRVYRDITDVNESYLTELDTSPLLQAAFMVTALKGVGTHWDSRAGASRLDKNRRLILFLEQVLRSEDWDADSYRALKREFSIL